MFRKFWAFWLTLAVVVTPQATIAQTIEELRQQGEAAYRSGNYAQAELIWRRVINQKPDSVAYVWLGSTLYNQGKLPEAEQSYRRALSLPDRKGTPASAHTTAHNALGYALQQQGDLQGAIAEYKKSLQIDPNYTPAQNNLREAERLLAQQRTPPPPSDLAYVPSPEDEPLVYEMRSTVRIITENSQGKDSGTGWIFKREGDTLWIMTNRHVIQHGNRPSETIEVEFFSTLDYKQRLRYNATLEHITRPGDPLDLAVIKVEGIRADDDTIRPLKFHSGAIPLTQQVTIIGHPYNLTDHWNVVIGNVTNVNLNSHKMTLDANLASGNSGGPILNSETKEVIGIVIQLITTEGIDTDPNIGGDGLSADFIATRGFGFGHPIDSVVEQLRRWRMIN